MKIKIYNKRDSERSKNFFLIRVDSYNNSVTILTCSKKLLRFSYIFGNDMCSLTEFVRILD